MYEKCLKKARNEKHSLYIFGWQFDACPGMYHAWHNIYNSNA
jgi:hypothetical protein